MFAKYWNKSEERDSWVACQCRLFALISADWHTSCVAIHFTSSQHAVRTTKNQIVIIWPWMICVSMCRCKQKQQFPTSMCATCTIHFTSLFSTLYFLTSNVRREVVEFRWDTQNTQKLPYWEYWEYMGWKGTERQCGKCPHTSVLMDINNLEIRSLFTKLLLGITLVVWIRESGSNSDRCLTHIRDAAHSESYRVSQFVV